MADGPSGKELDQTAFKFPSVTPLFEKDAAKQYWIKQREKHDARYMEVPDPLRSLLRARSRQDDPDLAGYKKLILAQQQELNPILMKQLFAETGSGVSIVVGPMTLKDLFGCGALFTDEPAFTKSDHTKRGSAADVGGCLARGEKFAMFEWSVACLPSNDGTEEDRSDYFQRSASKDKLGRGTNDSQKL